ncbi:gamma-aminobutyric acid receptor subunit beta-2-like [Tigriopus californicus]|uniref:gamma-aminobutyric acid receptor subunit beta-2-like n=1 Tax=Tigriopus californicus TaxID=6832 RepID=UPI0027DAB409|nr:gamma-aminobutyric acid receptor subunit beta-2-like [Tigriopus californicus]
MRLLMEDEPLLEDMTQSIEALLFSGETNSIIMTREYYQDYSCQFDLRYYPFDSQVCKLLFDVQGLPDQYTILKPDHNGVEFIGTRSLVEFDILLERLEVFSVNNISEAEVKFVFRRRMEFHVTNTFLQTFILIGIGFMSLYFDVDNFSDRIMVTLTTMLVIATITASIQASLPKTSYYKLIDWWLLFSLNALVLTMCFHTGIAHLCYKAKRAASPALIIKGYRSKSASNLISPPKVNSLVNSGFPNEDFRRHFYYRRAHRVNFWGKVAFVALILTFNVAFWYSALTEYSRPPSDLL